MTIVNEYALVEGPILVRLTGSLAYRTIHPAEHWILPTRGEWRHSAAACATAACVSS